MTSLGNDGALAPVKISPDKDVLDDWLRLVQTRLVASSIPLCGSCLGRDRLISHDDNRIEVNLFAQLLKRINKYQN